jgi:hypothetical protein
MRPEEHIARTVQATNRRAYHAPFPNAIWHIDGNHKLINWKFVIHGGIDGHSHLVSFMTVSDNNRASIVRRTFLKGAQTWGWPSRVRADCGGENLLVKEEMEQLRGKSQGLTAFIATAHTLILQARIEGRSLLGNPFTARGLNDCGAMYETVLSRGTPRSSKASRLRAIWIASTPFTFTVFIVCSLL